MYTRKGITYADAGNYLHGGNRIGFQLQTDERLEERAIDTQDIRIDGDVVVCSGDNIMIRYFPDYSYEDWKIYLIRMRYSNDDQIAIMLNRENGGEDSEDYDKMQQWRDWASNMAKLIVKLNNVKGEE